MIFCSNSRDHNVNFNLVYAIPTISSLLSLLLFGFISTSSNFNDLFVFDLETHFNTLQNSWFSFWEKKNTQNEHIIAHFEYLFTCHYSKTVWLAENLNEIKITHYKKIFSHIRQKFPHFEKGLGINNIFVVSLRLPLFSPGYISH